MCALKNNHFNMKDKTNLLETIQTNPNNKPKVKNPNSEDHIQEVEKSSTSVRSVITEIVASENEWPKELLKTIIIRFGRMPRHGWQFALETYNKKFNANINLNQFQKIARSALKNTAGQQCSQVKYKDSSKAKIKTIEAYFVDKSIQEQKLYSNIQNSLLSTINELENCPVDEAERTPKIPRAKVKPQILTMIDEALREYIEKKQPSNMSDIARLLQAAQICYKNITHEDRRPSDWLASIEAKIQKCKDIRTLIKRTSTSITLDDEETKHLKKGLREVGMSVKIIKDLRTTEFTMNERIAVYNKKLDMHRKRSEFRKTNTLFELHRARFYRTMMENETMEHSVPEDEITSFWETMWRKEDPEGPKDYSEYLLEFPPTGTHETTFPSPTEFLEIIKWLPNWKAAGCDGIHNFFIKKITCLHEQIYKTIRDICINGREQERWFYKGITYLIPKATPKRGSDFRPITCMSNLYKVTTKCVSKVMQIETEIRGLLSDNQLGTVRQVQGAKEQALINIAINKEHNNKLKTSWVDVKKAFDSVNHDYLIQCIQKLNFPEWIQKFLTSLLSKWEISLRNNNKEILHKKIERGILQGDSLSPLLFVLCLDPLSRRLNALYPKVNIEIEELSYSTNHLLFIDDLKLFSRNEEGAISLLTESQKFFKNVGLEINRDKSATNAETCKSIAAEISTREGYKYLGITENAQNETSPVTWERVKEEMYTRAEKLCQTKLNGKNMVRAINEYALSLINYYVGVLKIEPEEYQKVDKDIRQILIKFDIHKQPACKQRLYLSRDEMGRGFQNIEHKSESMLLQLYYCLTSKNNSSLRRNAIMKVEQNNKSHLSQIIQYLITKYDLKEILQDDQLNGKRLKEAQKESLHKEIQQKYHHKKLFDMRNNNLFSLGDSSNWLKVGRNTSKEEASICFLQDRNMFMGEDTKCPHCKDKKKTVEHMATKCNRMLSYGYTRRHNEVVRCIHLHLCQEYGLKQTKNIRSHSVQETIGNEKVEIRVDTRIRTDVRIQNNKPDIFVLDKVKKTITLIEVGITSQENLQKVETEKLRKYDLLANELGLMYKCKTVIIPYVITWDGLVTQYHRKYVSLLGIPRPTEGYIQSIIMKRTLENISLEYRRRYEDDKDQADKLTETPEPKNSKVDGPPTETHC